MNKQKGITLIALIITIIVMLILVAVTITVALNGGIFDRAKNASENTQKEADREMLLSALIATVDNQGNFHADQLVLPSGFTKNGTVYKSGAGNEFTINETTGKVEDYIDDGKVIVDDLIPTAEQKANAKYYQGDESETYGYASEVINYEESDNTKTVSISTSEGFYFWACDEATATALGSAFSIQNMQPNKWYFGTETFAQYNGNCPINKNDYTSEEMESEEYVNRVIASFKATNN